MIRDIPASTGPLVAFTAPLSVQKGNSGGVSHHSHFKDSRCRGW